MVSDVASAGVSGAVAAGASGTETSVVSVASGVASALGASRFVVVESSESIVLPQLIIDIIT